MWEKNKGTTEYDKSIVICDVDTAQCEDDIIKYEKKKKGTTECDKSTFTCDVNTAQCENSTIECEKKIMKLPNVTKVQLHEILVLYNVRMVLSNVSFSNLI